EEEVIKRMDDQVARMLQEYLGKVTFGHARSMVDVFNLVLQRRLEELVEEEGKVRTGPDSRPWGIHIRTSYIKIPHPGLTVNTARAKASAAVSDKLTTIRNSEAEAQKIKNIAVAEGDAEIEKGRGEAG